MNGCFLPFFFLLPQISWKVSMDMNFHQAGMPRLVGPAGTGGTGTGPGGPGSGISTQFRILPNPIPSECTSTEIEIIPAHSHPQPLKLRCTAPPSHRPFSSEPLHSPHSPPQDHNTVLLHKSGSLLLQAGKKSTTLLLHSHSVPQTCDLLLSEDDLNSKHFTEMVGTLE
ncbi:unnamed protein product [Sphagnum troendelagicum]|uniref:Uncharacterized protein n=1 Tax=Sphagnum troendelagicum TaxID=128251 RepID=A0ABP0TWL4_9BRYO